jgi:hypothetical protein
MAIEPGEILLAHERDAAWLMALYLAVHGGDPPPEEGVVSHELQEAAALAAVLAISQALGEKAREAVHHALAPLQKQFPMKSVGAEVVEARLAALGVRVMEHAGGHAHAEADEFRPNRVYCFRFNGGLICTEVRSPAAVPLG